MDIDMAVVRLTASYKQWNAGEKASFPLDVVGELITQGAATLEDENVTLADLGLEPDGSSEKEQAVDTRAHEMTVPQVADLVASVEGLEELQRIWDGEKEHPDHDGGRRGALQAIRTRAQELKANAEKATEA